MWVHASQVALVIKNLPANAGDIRDAGSMSGSGRSFGGGYGNPLQCSCLVNAMDREAWQAIIHRMVKSQTRLKWLTMHASIYIIHMYIHIHKHTFRSKQRPYSFRFPILAVIRCSNTVAGRRTSSGPEIGLLSNTQKWIVWRDTCADKARDFIGKGHPSGEQ